MVPRAKKNLHECEYHYKNMLKAKNVEEFEICFASFVNSARNITFVLQKEYKKNQKFSKWYEEKQKEMNDDLLCKFFNKLRTNIVHEGINGIQYQTRISSLNTRKDLPDRPQNSSLVISPKGIFYLINKGTEKEDFIPSKTTAQLLTIIRLENLPNNVKDRNIFRLCEIYYQYLKKLVEEWTEIINEKS